MIIGFDAGPLSVDDKRLKVGVYRMTQELLSHLTQIDKKNTYKIYSFKKLDLTSLNINPHNTENIVLPKVLWHSLWLPRQLQRRAVDVFIGPAQSLPRLPPKTKSIVFVHDLTFEKNPQWFAKTYARMSTNTRSAVSRADRIIAVSHESKRDLTALYGIAENKIQVISEGISKKIQPASTKQDDAILKKLGITKNYLLFVGTYKQSKNIPRIIKAFTLFSQTRPHVQLVLAGSNLWLDPLIPRTLKQSPAQKNIIDVDFVGDQELTVLYRQALCFVSPSLAEGFGLTHLEALESGIPVVAANIKVSKETLENHAIFVNPLDPTDIVRGITIALRQKPTPKSRSKVKNFLKKYSWPHLAKETLKVIEDIKKTT